MSDAPAPLDPALARRHTAGRLLFAIGALTLPLGFGAAGGYWLADRGARWVPTMVGGLLALWLAALGAMLLGSFLLGPRVGRPLGRKRVVALVAMIVLACVARIAVHVVANPAPLTTLTEADFNRVWRADAAQYRALDRELRSVVHALAAQPGLFDGEGARVLTADEEADVAALWRGWLDTAFALDQIRRFHEDYFRFDLSRLERERHLRSFLLTFAAELSLYAHTAELTALLDRNRDVVRFLDTSARARRGGRDDVASVREELAGVSDLGRVLAGGQYLTWLQRAWDGRTEALAGGFDWLWSECEAHLAVVGAAQPQQLAALSVASDVAPIGRGLKRAFYPVQKAVAEWLGDTRVRRAGHYLITAEQVAAARPRLRPGDVLLSRKNWYLSNVGLPGYWPHAMLYLGSDAQLAEAFDADAEVQALVAERCGAPMPFARCLAQRFPQAAESRRRAAAGAEPLVVLEAISEGVVLSSLEHAAGDSLAALRPRLSARARAEALLRAFGFLGRPYDFDFDFSTDHALVCTELVWRSYRPHGDGPGLRLEPLRMAGRPTLPANEIARAFEQERERADAQLELVLFLDAIEAEQRAVEADVAAFVASVERSKWDFRQP